MITSPKIRWFWLFLLIPPYVLFAQPEYINFENISLEQGLSQTAVNSIFQDEKGFMWFGTQDGLNKYDGYHFTIYKHDPRNLQSISHNYIWSIIEDQSGNLWIGTNGGGINRFNKESETFTRFQHNPNDPQSLSNNLGCTVYEDDLGVLWVGTAGGGLNRFDHNSETFSHFQNDPNNSNSLSENFIRSILEDRSGKLWIGTNSGGINKFDRSLETFRRYNNVPEDPQSLSHNSAWYIYEDHLGVLWIGTYGGGLNQYNPENEKFNRFLNDPGNPYSLSHNVVSSIYEDRASTLWIGTMDGLNKFDRNNKLFLSHKSEPNNYVNLNDNIIFSIFEDKCGILWIGTQTGGIYRSDPNRKKFIHYTMEQGKTKNLNNRSVRSILKDDQGLLWIATDYGLNKFNREKNEYYHVNSKNINLNDTDINVLFQDRFNVLWIGSIWGGLYKYDMTKNTVKHYQHDPTNSSSLSDGSITTIIEDQSGILWIGTAYGGLNRFDRRTQKFKRFQHDPDKAWSISDNIVFALHEDKHEILWVGTMNGGLNKFDKNTEKFTVYRHEPGNPKSLSDNMINVIKEDQRGILWIGTGIGGLNVFNKDTKTFTHFTENDGLSNNLICGILVDHKGDLWISTANGLSNFNPSTKTFRNFDVSDGLQSNEFNVGAYFKSNSGEMFFGGINGFNAFYPDSIKENTDIPPVYITSFERINVDSSEGIPTIEKGITEKDYIQLSYKDNIMSFEFSALNYRNAFKNQYSYKLEGFTDNWIHLGTQRRVTFTNLDPGEYTLRVKGSNNDGVWNEEGTSLKITILPPWWKTWWAYAIYSFIIISLFFGARKFELSRQKFKHDLEIEHIEKKKAQEVEKMKSRFFANISHEFRTPLTLIRGPIQQLLSGSFRGNISEQYKMILRNCNRLLNLISQLLDLSRIESGKLKLKASPINITELTRQLTMAFESLAKRKQIQLKFDALNKEKIIYIDRDKYEKIINNLLSNALKFTEAGGSVNLVVKPSQSVRLSSSQSSVDNLNNEEVEIAIKDTGVGISNEHLPYIFNRFYQVDDSGVQEQGGTGIGLALTKELVELHYGEIIVESELGKGSTFTVFFPLGKAHLKSEEIVEDQLEGSGVDKSVYPIPATIENKQLSFTEKQPVVEKSSTILIVEDNPDMRYYIKNHLHLKYTIIEAENGEVGLKHAQKYLPDLIISDVMMPKMDGYRFCEKIKTNPNISHIPVILLTAKASRDSKLDGLEIGADDYLTKPFDAEELQVRIKNLIKQRQNLRELFQRSITVEPKQITVTSMDEEFIKKAIEVVEKNIDNTRLDTTTLAREVGIGRSQLNVKLRALTGCSSREFIRILRLKRAAHLLMGKSGNVAEIAYEVGFNSLSHFSKVFKKQFNVLPSDYKKTTV